MVNSDSKSPTIPADDLNRSFAVARPNSDDSLPHVCVVGNTYTILLGGRDTAGRYCLIDMLVPTGGGPPPHRHDFEEMFTILDGEVQFTFRGENTLVRAGETVNVPANAPHFFRNVSGRVARMLCMCTPSGQEEFFLAIGDRVPSRTSAPPELNAEEQEERKQRAQRLAPKYRTELLI
jgi:mannose-6-phosphate isomerase-like protein (cupin superfamily)